MSSKVFVIHDPSISEISEMLECCALDADLDSVLPSIDPLKRAETMQLGWCLLWFDAQTLAPLGYTYFEFVDKNAKKAPYFHFCATRFLRLGHVRSIRASIMRVFKNALKNRVRAYIPYDNNHAQSFAALAGFRPMELTEKGMIWDLAPPQARR